MKCALPDDALLARYTKTDAYTDCYSTEISGTVSFVEYVTAFYTTCLFKLERVILQCAIAKPSTDAETSLLAEGETDTFAAWYVEARGENEILLCDFRNRTRSWLMVSPLLDDSGARTRLYFGSAVVPVRDRHFGKSSLGWSFGALAMFHRAYSVALLYSAKSRLKAKHEWVAGRKD
jgi:hypothetical protein